MNKIKVKKMIAGILGSFAFASLAFFGLSIQPAKAQTPAAITKTQIPGFQDGIKFESLPLDAAIVRVKGDGTRKLAMIGDPACPVCRMQEQELQRLDNVTIYTFAENILNSADGPELVRRIWCHADNTSRADAWEAWLKEGKEPAEHSACTTAPYSMLDQLGELKNGRGKLYRHTSPTLVLGNSITSNGLVRARDLEELLSIKP